jgi:DNA-binding CsgD family transcriptional regulator
MSQARVEQKYQLNNHLLLFEREGNILHAHGFATTQNDPNVINVYLNNLDRLKAYCHYFREETTDLQKKLDHIKVDFTKYIGQEFFKNGLNKEKGAHEKAQREFCFKLYESKGGLKPLKPLSKREMECLERMLDGKSAAIIAQDLSLKTRTVEFYIEGIKNKLSCSSKYEIFEFVNSLKALGGDLDLLKYSWH